MKKLLLFFAVLSLQNQLQAQPWATMVADYTPGKNGSFPNGNNLPAGIVGRGIYTAGSKLYFDKQHDTHIDPYAFDGSNYIQLAELSTANNTRFYADLNGKAYFLIVDGADAGLWSSNGTQQGTQKVKSISFDNSHITNPATMLVCNNALYFLQYYTENNLSKSSIWKSDGTSAGTKRVKELAASTTSNASLNVFLKSIVGNKVFFEVGSYPSQLWVSDGTTAGTHKVLHDWEYAQGYYNGHYYSVNNNANGSGLYVTDGTQSGTMIVKQLATTGMSVQQTFTDLNGKAVFSTLDNVGGDTRLWITDGTDAGTQLLASYKGMSALIGGFQTIGNKYFFNVLQMQYSACYMAVTDGTAAGTKILNNNFPLGTLPGNYTTYAFNGKLYYPHMVQNGSPNIYCDAVYYTDGTDAGTGKVDGGIISTSNISSIFGAANNQLYCIGWDETHGTELWHLFDFPLNVSSVKNNAQVIYPNPASNSFSVRTEDTNNTTVTVYSLNGQLLLQTTSTKNIDIHALPAGIYNVQALCNSKLQIARLVKE
ncbi:MAG: T9SS type A sorting domain-containing protein [Sphingobacteriales bacterium]|nr:MAG: T9SS type A sorting domain-containing protein [Sphingobacteriales bacterium]